MHDVDEGVGSVVDLFVFLGHAGEAALEGLVVVDVRDPAFAMQFSCFLGDVAIVLLDHRIQILVPQGIFDDDIPLFVKLFQLLCGEFQSDLPGMGCLRDILGLSG